MKSTDRWYSSRVGTDVSVVRWGHFGRPVILFPTAGGDAEEVERMGLVAALAGLIEAGRIKVYSCDSVAGWAMARGDGDARYRAALLNGFHEFVRHEMIPAIWTDCGSPGLDVTVTGASIGAFNALAMLCRYPDVIDVAIGMSGTYEVDGFVGPDAGDDLYFATPMWFVPGLDGAVLDRLRHRFAILASGEGRWEDIDQSWRLASVLGAKGVPNRVDAWGKEYDHDWPTWRSMLPVYLSDLT
ncbi:MAG: alpha/beta hydrolase-fold protein [Candidatus Dormibacteraeota bacterium]|nr:alpha/beta hydrolase-fold protein [Candidatus Dormibacteraeota bacterium]